MTNPVVHLEGITRTYEKGDLKVQALKGVSLAVHPGEYVAIMGPSGSGKSTMLHLLGLLDRPNGGSYRLNGQEVAGLGDDERSGLRNRHIGFIFQGFNLFMQLDVVANVEVPMSYANVPMRDRRRRAEALIEQVGLAHRRKHRPNELSGGEMQRVAIARALANDPSLILADEPTGNLDTSTADSISSMLDDLHRRGRTIIMVTHNPDMGARTDRVVRVRDGAILDGAA